MVGGVLQFMSIPMHETVPDWVWLLLGHGFSFLASLAACMFLAARLLRPMHRQRERLGELPKRLQIARELLGISTAQFDTTIRWEDLESIEHDPQYIYLFRKKKPTDAVVIPKSAMSGEGAIEKFCALAVEFHQAALDRKSNLPPRVLPPQVVTAETGNPYQPPRTS
jgi:hypothetical protein